MLASFEFHAPIDLLNFVRILALQVQAVLLLLGAQELPPEVASLADPSRQNERVCLLGR